MNPKYLFVCREGSTEVFTSDLEPTQCDIESIEAGMLDVIRLDDMRRLTATGIWEKIVDGIVTTVTMDGEARGPFHAPAGSDEDPIDPIDQFRN